VASKYARELEQCMNDNYMNDIPTCTNSCLGENSKQLHAEACMQQLQHATHPAR